MSLRNTPFAIAGPNNTVNLTVSTVPGIVQFDNILPAGVPPTGNPSQPLRNHSRTVRIFNAGPSTAFIEFLGKDQPNPASASSSYPLGSGVERIFSQAGADYLGAITASGPATLYVTPGEGGI